MTKRAEFLENLHLNQCMHYDCTIPHDLTQGGTAMTMLNASASEAEAFSIGFRLAVRLLLEGLQS